MASWTILKEAIADVIKTNDNQKITGQILQNVLSSIVDTVGENASFAGIAKPYTSPAGIIDGPLFYFAIEEGTYVNFDSIVVEHGEIAIIEYKGGVWSKSTISRNFTEELLGRLQGTSSNRDGYKDPVFYKEFVGSATLEDMNTWLNNQFFAIKDGVYYRNGESSSYAISKDVPQCLINLSYQGVKIYVYNAPRSFATGTFEQFAIGAAVRGNGITWGSGIYRRKSTYDFSTKQATWSNWESLTSSSATEEYINAQLATKVDKVSGKGLSTNDYTTEEKNLVATIPSKASEEYVDENIELLAKQRTSFVTPCFSDCDSIHEAKCNSITLAGGELGFGFKSIFSVTIKIAENLSLLNYTSTYLHIKDLFGNSIGVSMNGVKQMQNLGKYATWFFNSAINTSGAPIVLSLHTTNVASSASDSNRVMIIAHVNQREGMRGCGVTDENGTYHTNWTPALGVNIVDLSAIYPQIKELQKYRMAYATSELPDISTTGHKANVKEIRINQNVMGISLVNSVSIMVASDSAYSGALELRVYDINDNLIATSNNTVNLSQNLGKYVTWYFTPFQLNTDAIYKFSVWYSGTSQVMRIHVASGKSEGVTCFDQNNSPHTDYCPAFGINISAIFADDLRKSIKEVNLALGKEISTNSSHIASLTATIPNKANKADVDAQLATKASTTYIDDKLKTKANLEDLKRFPNAIESQFTGGEIYEFSPMSFYTWDNGSPEYGDAYPVLKTCIDTYNGDMYAFDESKATFMMFTWDVSKNKWVYQSHLYKDFSDEYEKENNRKLIDLETPGYDLLLSTPYLSLHLGELYKHFTERLNGLEARINALEARIAALEAK